LQIETDNLFGVLIASEKQQPYRGDTYFVSYSMANKHLLLLTASLD
jgi:hypothetical protein